MARRTLSHPALDAFAPLANAYCAVVEHCSDSNAAESLTEIHRLLPQLYAAALALPSTSELFDEADADSSEDDSSDLKTAPDPPIPAINLDPIAGVLGLRRYYREIFDPYDEREGPGPVGDLLDDLGDIHGDLTRGLHFWRQGESGDALWEWRFLFQTHWGEHATSALRALFAYCAWHDLPWPAAAG